MKHSENRTWIPNKTKVSFLSKTMDALVYLANQHSLSLAIIVLMGSGLILTNLYLLSSRLNKSTALQNAQAISDSIRQFRNLSIKDYRSEVNLSGKEDDENRESRGIPNIAHSNMKIKMGKSVDFGGMDGEVKFFSHFPSNPTNKIDSRDAFEENALKFLGKNPDQIYTRFEKYGGRWSLRHATADLMRPHCIRCHNQDQNSSKKQWEINDFAGVLEVIVPLDRVKKTIQNDLLGYFLFMTTITILGLAFLTLVISVLRRSTVEAHILTEKTKEMNLELQEEIRERSNIESVLADRTAELEEINGKLHQQIRDRKDALAESETIRRELEEFNKVAVGRELKMLEMKKRLNKLLKELGKDEYYNIET